jgi:hypothetical protein
MRKLIAGMQISLDEKVEGAEGYADWVDAWSDAYDLIPQVDACLLGAGMYPGYEQYWTAVQKEPDKPLPMASGRSPRPGRVPDAGGGRIRPLRCSDPALCVIEHPDFGSLARHEIRPWNR